MRPIVAQPTRRPILLIAISVCLVILSFGSIVALGFVRDDYTNLYHIQQGLLLPYPYFADTIRLWPLYQLFHLTPDLYYLIAVLLFGIATTVLYWLSYLLSGKRLIATTTALFFIFSLVGSYAMYVMTEAIRHTTYLIFQLTTMSLFSLFLKSGKRLFYLLSLLFFGVTLLFFPYRAFTFIVVLFLLSIFFLKQKRSLFMGMRSLFPFFITVVITYGLIPRLPTVQNIRPIHLDILTNALSWNALSNYLLTFLFLFLPSTFITSHVPIDSWLRVSRILSLPFMFFVVFFVLIAKKSPLQRVLRFSLVSLLVTLGGFIGYAPAYYVSGDRYLMTIRPFLALFLGAVFVQPLSRLSSGKRKYRIQSVLILGLVFFIFVLQVVENFRTQYQAIQYFGPSAKNIIASVRQAIPALPDYSIVFVDAQTNELRDTYVDPFRVGALPASASLAVYYGTRYENIELIDYIHCDVMTQTLKRWEGKSVRVFYFLGTEEGLIPGKPTQAFERCNIHE